MKNLLISNLCTFILTAGASFFVYSSSLEKETEAIVYQYKVKNIKESALERRPSSIHIPKEAVRIAEARAEMARLKQNLKYDPDNWNDAFLMHYQGTRKVNGEIVSLSDLYRPFFTEVHKTLKKYYGKDASKRISELLAARKRFIEARDLADHELEMAHDLRNEKIQIALNAKIQNLEKELAQDEEIPEEEVKILIERFKEKQLAFLEAKYDSEEYSKYEKVTQTYEYQKKKILGPAYVEFERLKDHYNEQYHKAYGNSYYMSHGEWDEVEKEWVRYETPIEKETDSPEFKIDI